MDNDTKMLLAIANSLGFNSTNPLSNLWDLKEYLFDKLDEYKNKVVMYAKQRNEPMAMRYSTKFDDIHTTLGQLFKNKEFKKCYV